MSHAKRDMKNSRRSVQTISVVTRARKLSLGNFMGQFVKDGDTTSTRGVVSAVTSRMFDKSRRLALDGDEATCGNCKGSFKIVGTATRMHDKGGC